ncbi:MAG: alpha/beta hydrolase, partial [Smithellaceae bacterium]|nr:alpha/beta hydrolase [Smithellaceae bacterium]
SPVVCNRVFVGLSSIITRCYISRSCVLAKVLSMSLDAPRWASLAGKRFSMPSLYIYGNEDSVIIPANITHLEDCFDSIQVEQIKAAHFLQEEKPREVAELMNQFFKKTIL